MLSGILPRQIDDDLHVLGSMDVPVYFLRLGDKSWALIEGGISRDAELTWEHMTSLIQSPDHVHYWLITHKHYDHCGLLPYLVPRLKQVRVVVSQKTWKSWQNPEARKLIASLNARILRGKQTMPHCVDLHTLPVQLVDGGVALELGEKQTIRVISAPGHSSDQIIFLDVYHQRLFTADAMGEFNDADNTWNPLMFDNVAQYLDTLALIRSLAPRQLITAHDGILSGKHAKHAVDHAFQQCHDFIVRTMPELSDEKALERFARKLHGQWAAQSASFVPADLHLNSMRFMLKGIANYQLARERKTHVC